MPLSALSCRYSADLWSNWDQSMFKVDWQGRSNPIPAQQWSVLYMKWKRVESLLQLLFLSSCWQSLSFLRAALVFDVNDQGWSDLCMYWLLVTFSLCKALNKRVNVTHILALKTKQPEYFLVPCYGLPRKTQFCDRHLPSKSERGVVLLTLLFGGEELKQVGIVLYKATNVFYGGDRTHT